MDEYLHWVFIVTALTLVFLVFAINPLQAAIEEAVQNHAQLQGQRLISMINIAQKSPDGTEYKFEMPKLNCTVHMSDNILKITISPAVGIDVIYAGSVTKTSTEITLVKTPPVDEFRCRDNGIILLQKTGGKLLISAK